MFLSSLSAKVYVPICSLIIVAAASAGFIDSTLLGLSALVVIEGTLFKLLLFSAQWQICQTVAPGVARRNILVIKGEVKPQSACGIARRLQYVVPDEPVVILVNSQGGDVASARTIIQAIRDCPGKVRIIATQRCLSSAFLIACSVPTSDRFMTTECSILIHGISPGTNRKRTAVVHDADEWFTELVTNPDGNICYEKANEWIADHLSEGTILKRTLLIDVLNSGGNLTFDASAALKNGLVGRII